MSAPIILYEGQYSRKELDELKRKNKIWKINDIYEKQLEELFEILNPQERLSKEFFIKQTKFVSARTKNGNSGNWIYYPWNGYLVHAVNEKDYFLLRTNRNREIISREEQNKLYDSLVGFIGLSIGSHFALNLAYSGISKTMKLAEFDEVSTSNLNRVRARLKDIKLPKIELLSREIYEIDPYAKILLFNQGLNEGNLVPFFTQGKKLEIVFEAIDDFEMKIRLRLEARRQKVPVIMLTNLGDNLLIDIERYDLNSSLPLFNGLIGNTPEEIIGAKISEKDKIKYAIKIVGEKYLSNRLLKSLDQINKTLVGRPQIFSTVNVGGGLAAFLARKLILDKTLKSGRFLISLGKLLNLPDGENDQKAREEILERLRHDVGI